MKSYRAPELSPVPVAQQRLIDTGMLHLDTSLAGKNERYRRGETSHTIHVWWARRPHSAMRALIYSALCQEDSPENRELMVQLAEDCPPQALKQARKLARTAEGERLRVLDMFGGGGTIAFESKNLGAEAWAIDANQMSVFIQRCNILYPDRVNLPRACELTEAVGHEVLERLQERTAWLFPRRGEGGIFGYLWSYRCTCPHCGGSFYLSKRPTLSKKKGRHLRFCSELTAGKGERLHIVELGEDAAPFSPHWQGRSPNAVCPHCATSIRQPQVKECEDALLAVISNARRGGKFFLPVTGKELPSAEAITTAERELLAGMCATLPESPLPKWSGIINPAIYGMETHADIFNRRQRLVLLYLIDELLRAHRRMASEDEQMARFVIGALSSLIDQMVDWNCRLSMWIPQNEQVGRAFCGPGVAMLWDYVETDPVLNGPANLHDKLKRICQGIRSFSRDEEGGQAHILHAHAQELPFPDGHFDAIVTDPPYYDNIYYSLLADFFYSWKKLLLREVAPELFAAAITDCHHELVASSRRVLENESPHEKYCEQLGLAIQEASRTLKPDGLFVFIYSHSSIKGWEAVVRAYRSSRLRISSAQPLSIERKARPRAVTSQAVNTCLAFVARNSAEPRQADTLEHLLQRAQDEWLPFGQQLMTSSGWCADDAALAALACAIGHLANVSHLTDADDCTAISAVANLLSRHFPGYSIRKRDSL